LSCFTNQSRVVPDPGRLPPGQQKVLIELINAEHHAFTGQAVTLTVPVAAQVRELEFANVWAALPNSVATHGPVKPLD
jgi:hypothetical protein